jgi:hypothetical protein
MAFKKDEFYSTQYSIRRTGVPNTSSHPFSGVFLTSPVSFFFENDSPVSSYLDVSPPDRRTIPSLPNHRAPAPPADFIPIKSRPSTSLPHPNQQSFWFHPSLLTKSAMHQKVNQVPIILKFHPDLIKMIGFWYRMKVTTSSLWIKLIQWGPNSLYSTA